MRLRIIDRMPRPFRWWFWDHCQCRAANHLMPYMTVYCGRIRWHRGRHWWPVKDWP